MNSYNMGLDFFNVKASCVFPSSFSQSIGDLGFQDFHQRTLSASSSATAKLRCYAAAFLIPTFGIPPVLIGAAAASTGSCRNKKVST